MNAKSILFKTSILLWVAHFSAPIAHADEGSPVLDLRLAYKAPKATYLKINDQPVQDFRVAKPLPFQWPRFLRRETEKVATDEILKLQVELTFTRNPEIDVKPVTNRFESPAEFAGAYLFCLGSVGGALRPSNQLDYALQKRIPQTGGFPLATADESMQVVSSKASPFSDLRGVTITLLNDDHKLIICPLLVGYEEVQPGETWIIPHSFQATLDIYVSHAADSSKREMNIFFIDPSANGFKDISDRTLCLQYENKGFMACPSPQQEAELEEQLREYDRLSLKLEESRIDILMKKLREQLNEEPPRSPAKTKRKNPYI